MCNYGSPTQWQYAGIYGAVKILNPKQVVYISCDPSTQVRDIKYFAKIGYRGEVMYPVDMFPHTEHVETIVALKRR